MGGGWGIDIDRGDIRRASLVDDAPAAASIGEVVLSLDLFAMTANNVTYAALGRPTALFGNGKGYWDFFSPAGGDGRLPVWGFATVTASAAEGVAVGQSFYGYFPMAGEVVLCPSSVGPGGFVDGAEHRADLPAVYNHYLPADAIPAEERAWWALFRPLYLTGWLIADQLAEEAEGDARPVIVTGASSKTAVGFAHAFTGTPGRGELIGLTSPRGREFAEATGLYDRLVDYDDIAALDLQSAQLVDIAGNGPVAAALHRSIPDLRHLIVGMAHWDAPPGAKVKADWFFAPARVAKRSAEWGGREFRTRIDAAFDGFLADARALYRIDLRHGPAGALAAYEEAVAGAADPQAGVVVTLA